MKSILETIKKVKINMTLVSADFIKPVLFLRALIKIKMFKLSRFVKVERVFSAFLVEII